MIMKKFLLLLLPLLVGANFLFFRMQTSDERKVKDGELAPTDDQVKVGLLVTQIFSQYHYKKTRLDDSLSANIMEQYLKNLDYNKMYFLASDIEKFNKHRFQLDDNLKDGEFAVPYEIFNVYRTRVKERDAYVKQLLEKEFDYTVDEYYDSEREKAPWAKSAAELNEVWRKYVKNQALSLKLAGKSWTEASKTLGDRYQNIDKSIAKSTSEDVFQAYMNSFAENIDPHTNYLSPASSANFKIEMSRTLEGIGATLKSENELTTVAEIIIGGPAFKSKLIKKGDKISAVAQGDDGKFVDVVGWRIDEVVKLIRGPKGTVVRLQIIPLEAGAEAAVTREIRIVRDKIKLEDQLAKGSVVPVTQNGKTQRLGVITIPSFYANFEDRQKGEKDYTSTTNDVRRIIGDLTKQGIDGLVLDLRSNGGGLLTEAVDLTGLFINEGPVVQVRNSNGSIEVLKDTDRDQVYSGPLAVMINRFSASASEIFAGAIQDYKRGIVIGEQTYGKGTVQSQVDLNRFLPGQADKLGQVNLTIAKFYRVTGSSTQHKGVTPDIQLPSMFSAAEFGESSQPNALPWDQIKSTTFKPLGTVMPDAIAKLDKRYQQDLKTDSDLQEVVKEIAAVQKSRSNTRVSLHESKRKKEREEAAQKIASLSEEAETLEEGTPPTGQPTKEKVKKDPYLKETTRLMAEYLSMNTK
jgi:carboxyl-terminal processing protease